jgi:hypothetical protein
MSQAHDDAAAQAADHLKAAIDVLREAYDHPHHDPRLDNIESQLTNLVSVIEVMPSQEDSRAEYASRLMAAYKTRTLDSHLPDHAERLLDQELARQ